jgi:KTSC domain
MPLESIPFATSSNIESIWHDSDTQTLLIRYHHQSRVYRYPGVPGDDAQGFSQALSANEYLQQFILSQYTGTFVGSVPPAGDGDPPDAQSLSNLLN